MIILTTEASYTGKTVLAQKLLENINIIGFVKEVYSMSKKKGVCLASLDSDYSMRLKYLAGWVMIAIYTVMVFLFGFFVPESRQYLALLSLTANVVLSLYFMWNKFGWKNSAVLIAISFVITIILENISIATGWPYGVFNHFLPGFRIGNVPIVVGFAYFSFCVIGWLYAELITENMKYSRILMPIVAGFVGSAIDALFDPIGSLVYKMWEYPNGGGLFGVPFSNSIGWIINIAITMYIFEVIVKTHSPAEASSMNLQAIVLLVLQVVPLILGHYSLEDEPLVDCTGMVWSSGALYEVLSILGLLVMGTLCINGFIVYYRSKRN